LRTTASEEPPLSVKCPHRANPSLTADVFYGQPLTLQTAKPELKKITKIVARDVFAELTVSVRVVNVQRFSARSRKCKPEPGPSPNLI